MRYFIAGGCGFIGSEMAKKLLQNEENEVVIYDNLSSGSLDLVKDISQDKRVSVVVGDIKDLKKLTYSMLYCDAVYHFASNADIAKAMADPTIDFYEGTLLTQNILEAMRRNGIKKIIYASGSGVYGDHLDAWVVEDCEDMHPISPYGASKLAGEALISAYCHLFDMVGIVFRFANVVGKNSTHGVIKDFIGKLHANPFRLDILGSGMQLKGYIHVDDVTDALLLMNKKIDSKGFYYYNVAPNTQITVTDIADMVIFEMKLNNVIINLESNTQYMGGWKGDVGIIKMNSDKLRGWGWMPTYESKGAVKTAIREMLGKE